MYSVSILIVTHVDGDSIVKRQLLLALVVIVTDSVAWPSWWRRSYTRTQVQSWMVCYSMWHQHHHYLGHIRLLAHRYMSHKSPRTMMMHASYSTLLSTSAILTRWSVEFVHWLRLISIFTFCWLESLNHKHHCSSHAFFTKGHFCTRIFCSHIFRVQQFSYFAAIYLQFE